MPDDQRCTHSGLRLAATPLRVNNSAGASIKSCDRSSCTPVREPPAKHVVAVLHAADLKLELPRGGRIPLDGEPLRVPHHLCGCAGGRGRTERSAAAGSAPGRCSGDRPRATCQNQGGSGTRRTVHRAADRGSSLGVCSATCEPTPVAGAHPPSLQGAALSSTLLQWYCGPRHTGRDRCRSRR